MRNVWLSGLCLLMLFAWTAALPAHEGHGKTVTLKGTILCAKCALKETDKCTTAIQVTEKGKTVTYYLHDKGEQEEYHEAVCGGDRKEGTVTGVVQDHNGKKHIKPSKVEYDKK